MLHVLSHFPPKLTKRLLNVTSFVILFWSHNDLK